MNTFTIMKRTLGGKYTTREKLLYTLQVELASHIHLSFSIKLIGAELWHMVHCTLYSVLCTLYEYRGSIKKENPCRF